MAAMRTAITKSAIVPSRSQWITPPPPATSGPSETAHNDLQKTKQEEYTTKLRTSFTITSKKENSGTTTVKKRPASPLENRRQKSYFRNDDDPENIKYQTVNKNKEQDKKQDITTDETRQKPEVPAKKTTPLQNLNSSRSSTPPRHTCLKCGKSFKRAHNLKIHGRMHNTDRPYKCPFNDCDKDFRWKSSFVSHVNWHRTKKGHRLPPNTLLSRVNNSRRQKCPALAGVDGKVVQQKGLDSPEKQKRKSGEPLHEKPRPFLAQQQSRSPQRVNCGTNSRLRNTVQHASAQDQKNGWEIERQGVFLESHFNEAQDHNHQHIEKTHNKGNVFEDRLESQQHVKLTQQLQFEQKTLPNSQSQSCLKGNRQNQAPLYERSEQQQTEWTETECKDRKQRRHDFYHTNKHAQTQCSVAPHHAHFTNQKFPKIPLQQIMQPHLHSQWQLVPSQPHDHVKLIYNTCDMTQQHLQHHRDYVLQQIERHITERNARQRRERDSGVPERQGTQFGEKQGIFDHSIKDNLESSEHDQSADLRLEYRKGILQKHETASHQLQLKNQADQNEPLNITINTGDHTCTTSLKTPYDPFQEPSEASISYCAAEFGSDLMGMETRPIVPMQLMSSEEVANDPEWNLEFDVATDMENEKLDRLFAELEKAGSMVEAKGGLYVKEDISQLKRTAPPLTPLNSPRRKQQHHENKLVSSCVTPSPGIRSRSTMSPPHLQNGIIDWIMKLGEESFIEDPNMQTPSTTESLEIISGNTQPKSDGLSPFPCDHEHTPEMNDDQVFLKSLTESPHISTDGDNVTMHLGDGA